MHYSKIYQTSITDGPGVRVSLYVSGCRNHCKGCHNPESWDFQFGKDFTEESESLILKLLDRYYIAGLSIVGGEPMEPENQKCLVSLVEKVKLAFPDKNIWCYTGYDLKDLLPGGRKYTKGITERLLACLDVLVAGRFELDKRDISDANRWRGSTNQRVLDVTKSVKKGKEIFVEGIPNNMLN